MSDMRRACQVFRLEELAEKLGFELTLGMLGDDDVAGTTHGSSQIRSAAAVLKNHARSYMKQARKAGMSLLQRLGTDAHYAFNCAVQDLTPRCMHWITVLGNVVLPNIKRTKEEIRTGKVRQYKARMCIVAQEPGQMQTLVVDDHVLFWFRNRFYRANQFAAAYAVLPIGDRFEVLSDANTTFQSLALSKEDVYADILYYVHDILRPLTEATGTEGGSRPLPATRQQNPEYAGLPGLDMDRIRVLLTGTRNRSGTTSTTNGPTRSGRIGVVGTRDISTGTVHTNRAIAEASRSGSSRLI
jgi:hypothetical protein